VAAISMKDAIGRKWPAKPIRSGGRRPIEIGIHIRRAIGQRASGRDMRRPAAEEEDDRKGQHRGDGEIVGYRLPEHVRPHPSYDQRLGTAAIQSHFEARAR